MTASKRLGMESSNPTLLEAGHSPVSSDEVKDLLGYRSTPHSRVFVAWRIIHHIVWRGIPHIVWRGIHIIVWSGLPLILWRDIPLYGPALPLAIHPVRHLLVREGDEYKTPTFVGSCDRLRLHGSGSLSRYSLIKLPP